MPDRPEDVSRLREAADEEVRRLRQLLRVRISESGKTQREVSRLIGVPWHYVGQLVSGGLDIRLYQVLEILSVLGLEPGAFFAELHGAGEGAEQAAVEALSAWLERGRPAGADANASPPAEAGEPAEEPAGEPRALREESLVQSKRTAELLRAKSRLLDRTLPDLGRAVGLNPSYLGQLLRGAEPIKAKQVYAVLRALAISPSAFYGELWPSSHAMHSAVIVLRNGRLQAAELGELQAWVEELVLRVLRDRGLLPPV